MAEFCTQCSKYMFGDEVEPDIDVEAIVKSLKPGYYKDGFLCEGCGLMGITKNKGQIVGYFLSEQKWLLYYDHVQKEIDKNG